MFGYCDDAVYGVLAGVCGCEVYPIVYPNADVKLPVVLYGMTGFSTERTKDGVTVVDAVYGVRVIGEGNDEVNRIADAIVDGFGGGCDAFLSVRMTGGGKSWGDGAYEAEMVYGVKVSFKQFVRWEREKLRVKS